MKTGDISCGDWQGEILLLNMGAESRSTMGCKVIGADSSEKGQFITEEPEVFLVDRFSVPNPVLRMLKSNGDLTKQCQSQRLV